jgi:RsiW-degrading membrane proteinase PrsW (M82 family)
MWWYYRQDVYEKEPVGLIALLFVLSMPLSVLVGLLQWVIDGGGQNILSENENFWLHIFFYLVVVAVPEELAKFMVVYTLTRRNKHFNEQIDGIIYAAAAALGFATFENIFFITDVGEFIILLRGPVSALAHVLFAAMWGASLGFAKFNPSPERQRRMIIYGLLRAILTHAIFDIFISLGAYLKMEWVSFISIVFIGFMYFVVSRQISFALRVSQYNPDNQAKREYRRIRQNQNNPNLIRNPFRQRSEKVETIEPVSSPEEEVKDETK